MQICLRCTSASIELDLPRAAPRVAEVGKIGLKNERTGSIFLDQETKGILLSFEMPRKKPQYGFFDLRLTTRDDETTHDR